MKYLSGMFGSRSGSSVHSCIQGASFHVMGISSWSSVILSRGILLVSSLVGGIVRT